MNNEIPNIQTLVPAGTDGYKIPFAKESFETTCPRTCPFNKFIPTDGNGVINYNEEYAGWQYCMKFQCKLDRVTAGTDTVFQVKGCTELSNEERYSTTESVELIEKINSLTNSLKSTLAKYASIREKKY